MWTLGVSGWTLILRVDSDLPACSFLSELSLATMFFLTISSASIPGVFKMSLPSSLEPQISSCYITQPERETRVCQQWSASSTGDTRSLLSDAEKTNWVQAWESGSRNKVMIHVWKTSIL